MAEFFAPAPLLAVALFGLNNLWLKAAFGNALTGKLSDVTACFFLPLLISALLEPLTRLELRSRLLWGAGVTALVFGAVKTSAAASRLLDQVLGALAQVLGLPSSTNLVDGTDLMALAFVPLAVAHALHRARCVRREP